MGLNCSHECWDGSYSSFRSFRIKLAALIGIPYLLMEGIYNEDIQRDLPDDIKRICPLEWGAFKPDVIHALLRHSDCDGKIPWYVCAMLAMRLKELNHETLNDEDFSKKLDKFIRGLHSAWSAKENVSFN
jgi:hypothetical protein